MKIKRICPTTYPLYYVFSANNQLFAEDFSANVFYIIVTHNILCINRDFVELRILYYVLNIFVIILKKKSHFGIRRLKKNPYIEAENTKTQLS